MAFNMVEYFSLSVRNLKAEANPSITSRQTIRTVKFGIWFVYVIMDVLVLSCAEDLADGTIAHADDAKSVGSTIGTYA